MVASCIKMMALQGLNVNFKCLSFLECTKEKKCQNSPETQLL